MMQSYFRKWTSNITEEVSISVNELLITMIFVIQNEI